jgi:enediyne biosynthesis protein E4
MRSATREAACASWIRYAFTMTPPGGYVPPVPLRVIVHLAFVSALGAVVVLGRERDPSRERGTTAPIAFREVAKTVGIDFRHLPFDPDPRIANVASHVAGIGASVALVDYDGDGHTDVFTTSSRAGSENALFRNRGDRTFERVPGAAGLAGENSAEDGASLGATFADLDGDADPNAVLYKFGYLHLYRNDGGRFVDVSADAGLRIWLNAPTATFLDHDRDGDLDLYVGCYFRDDIDLAKLTSTKIMQESFEFAKNGGGNRLFRNDGNLRFTDVTAGSGAGSTRWTLAVAALDIDGDGDQDLYLANDYGPEELLLNDGAGKFTLAAGTGLSEQSKSGMCVAVGDVRNDGRPSVFVTNICRAGYLFQGNNLRVNDLATTGRLEDIADQQNVKDCGWAWGAQFADFDNDGWQDLVVVNGFLSQSRERDYWFAMSKIASGAGDRFEDATDWPAIEDRSLSGYERSRVLHNVRGGQFFDVAKEAGVTDLLDGRGVAVGDLFNRGRQDLVVANRDAELLVYENISPAAGNWIQFRLRARGSNTSAIGACVRLDAASGGSCRIVTAACGFASQNDDRLHFGLGAEQRVGSVTIRWPSGREQVVTDLEAGRTHTIEEPSP